MTRVIIYIDCFKISILYPHNATLFARCQRRLSPVRACSLVLRCAMYYYHLSPSIYAGAPPPRPPACVYTTDIIITRRHVCMPESLSRSTVALAPPYAVH